LVRLFSLINNAEGEHISNPALGKYHLLLQSLALLQDLLDALDTANEPSAGILLLLKNELHNLYIKGTDTANILLNLL
jgi:hypothetical protein